MGDNAHMAVAQGVIEKRGSYFALDGETLAQGRDKARDLVLNDARLRERIAQRVISAKPSAVRSEAAPREPTNGQPSVAA